jgi:hypothetical protein
MGTMISWTYAQPWMTGYWRITLIILWAGARFEPRKGFWHRKVTSCSFRVISLDKVQSAIIQEWCRYFIFTETCSVNMKREREKSNKRFSIVCINYRREREMRIYDMWPCNASIKPIATCSDFSLSSTTFTDEKPS